MLSVGVIKILIWGLKNRVNPTMRFCCILLSNLGLVCTGIRFSDIELTYIISGGVGRVTHTDRGLGYRGGKYGPLALIPTGSNISYSSKKLIYHQLKRLEFRITVGAREVSHI